MTFEIIKRNYDRKLYDKATLRMLVPRFLTEQQYEEITGEEYSQ